MRIDANNNGDGFGENKLSNNKDNNRNSSRSISLASKKNSSVRSKRSKNSSIDLNEYKMN